MGTSGQKGFDPPRLFSAYLNTLQWNTVTSTDSRLFQSPWRAGIDVKAYQLERLRKALQLPRVNLFIADDSIVKTRKNPTIDHRTGQSTIGV